VFGNKSSKKRESPAAVPAFGSRLLGMTAEILEPSSIGFAIPMFIRWRLA
jgi:hypothetical protein